MELNLEEALDAPVELSQRLDVPVERLERPELVSLSPVTFQGVLRHLEPGFVLSGRLGFEGQAICARCLGPVPFTREADVSWVFSPAYRRSEGEEVELKADDLDVVYYEDYTVPFDPLVEEQLQLEIPLKPLCRPDCKGLCPRCGADRNAVACGCAPEGDARLEALRALLPKTS